MPGSATGLGQLREPDSVVADPSAGHHTPVNVDDCDIVMFGGPIDSTKQRQAAIAPSIDGSAVTGELTQLNDGKHQASPGSPHQEQTPVPQESHPH
jgi:hypothetical protein